MSVNGGVVLISGVARGQGRCHAVKMAHAGAKVIGFDICGQIDSVGYPMATKEDLDTTVKLVRDAGGEMVADVGDVRDRASIDAVLARGLDAFGRLDFVIANAGIMPLRGELANDVAAWHDCLDVLLTGVMHTVEATYPVLVRQGDGGAIVIISSMAGMQPTMRTEGAHSLGSLAYAACKAALVNLAQNYASFLAEHRIRVNTIHPAGVSTPMIHNEMLDDFFANGHPEDLKCMVPALPVRLIDPADISELVLWMCSDASRYLTGSAVRLDAGASLR